MKGKPQIFIEVEKLGRKVRLRVEDVLRLDLGPFQRIYLRKKEIVPLALWNLSFLDKVLVEERLDERELKTYGLVEEGCLDIAGKKYYVYSLHSHNLLLRSLKMFLKEYGIKADAEELARRMLVRAKSPELLLGMLNFLSRLLEIKRFKMSEDDLVRASGYFIQIATKEVFEIPREMIEKAESFWDIFEMIRRKVPLISAKDRYRRMALSLANQLKKLGVEELRILEVGCGPGDAATFFASEEFTMNIGVKELLLIDVSPLAIEMAKETFKGLKSRFPIEFKVIDAEKLEKLKKKFNFIVCSFVLNYLSPSKLERVVLAMVRSLSIPGAVMTEEEAYLFFKSGTDVYCVRVRPFERRTWTWYEGAFRKACESLGYRALF